MAAIDRILIYTMKKDLRLTRICVASIRHFYPDIRIDLVKDEGRGTFPTKELQEHWNCGVERFGKKKVGGSGMLTKLEPLFLSSPEKLLLLDSDTVLIGDLLSKIQHCQGQFIVSKDESHGDLTTNYGVSIVRSFLFDIDRLKQMVPNFQFLNRKFNAGHIFFQQEYQTELK